jgi:hypothetical protein
MVRTSLWAVEVQVVVVVVGGMKPHEGEDGADNDGEDGADADTDAEPDDSDADDDDDGNDGVEAGTHRGDRSKVRSEIAEGGTAAAVVAVVMAMGTEEEGEEGAEEGGGGGGLMGLRWWTWRRRMSFFFCSSGFALEGGSVEEVRKGSRWGRAMTKAGGGLRDLDMSRSSEVRRGE